MVKLGGTHRYSVDLTVGDYIDLSGGTTERADTAEIYIVKADGRIRSATQNNLWKFTPSETLSPGDTIVVPVNSTQKSLTQWRDVTQILYQSIVSVSAVLRL